jgi:sialidase-1
MRRILSTLVIWILLLSTVGADAQPSGQATVEISVDQLSYPAWAGSGTQPLFRIRVDVPDRFGAIEARSMDVRWGGATAPFPDSVQIYYTAGEPAFNNRQLLGKSPVRQHVWKQPLVRSLAPGIHFFWLCADIRGGTDLSSGILLESVRMNVLEGGKTRDLAWSGRIVKRVGSIVAKGGADNVHTYRIPGIVATDKGTLIAVYDIRYKNSADLPGDIDVGMSRSIDGGVTWEKTKVIMDMGEPHQENGVGDPAILYDAATKTIWVAALWSKGNRAIAGSETGLSPDSTGQIVLVSSKDDGLTWSTPYSITPQVKDPRWHIYFVGPGAGITMQDGTLVFATQYWDESAKPGIPHSSIIYSKDHGRTWASGKGVLSNTNEAQVIETSPGKLMINMRDNRGGFRSVATTSDMGQSWTMHRHTYRTFRDPICMASFTKLEVDVNGRRKPVVFFSNVDDADSRVNTTIKASMDLGETWLTQHQLLLDSRRSYGYSCLVGINSRTIGILYEGRGDIFFLRIPVGDIIR